MRRVLPVLLLLGALVGGGDGCVFRTLPIPPPGATASTQTCAPDLGCPSDGVIVTVRGLATPSAIVIAENISRGFSDGRRYSAQAFASPAVAPPVDAGDAGPASNTGSYELVLGPLPDPSGVPMLSRRGDRIAVFQLLRNAEGLFEISETAFVTVQ